MGAYGKRMAFVSLLLTALIGLLGVFAVQETAFADEALSLQSGSFTSSGEEVESQAALKHGWIKSGKTWQYWQAGTQVKGKWVDTATAPAGMKKAQSGKQRYWIDANGELAVNRLIDPTTAQDAGAYYAYATKQGFVATGKCKVVTGDTARVYLGKTKGSRIGELETGDKYGMLRTKAYDNGVMRAYYIHPKAHAAVIKADISKATPVKVKGFGWVFPCNKGGFLLAGKKKIVGNRVYLAKQNGKLEDGGKDHVLATTAYDKGTKRFYYINPKTHSAVVKKYAVYAKGFGWVLSCYKGGYLATGRKVLGNRVYLAHSNGKLETGNKQGFLSTKRYSSDGSAQRYYIDPRTHSVIYGKPVHVKSFGYVYAPNKWGYLLRGVTRVDSKHVVLASNSGKLFTKRGWVVTSQFSNGKERYWMEPTAKNKKVYGARTGYFYVNGSLYLGLDDGSVLRNEWHYYDGSYFSVDNDGVFNYDYVISRLCNLAQSYWSPSQYLIMVDIDDPQVVVFEGSQWNWSVKYVMDCCTGTPATPTPEGTFSIGARGYSFGESEGFSCYYWTQYYGPYYFHTRMYYPNEWVLMDERIGRERVSHGCIRLYDEDAYWIWTQVPSGTTVGCVY